MKVTIVRHGETVENKARIIQGQSRGSLNQTGIEQARQTGAKLKGRKFDFVYCSDLKRCVDTANEITKQSGIKVDSHESALREKSFGEIEGTSALSLDWSRFSGDFMTRKPSGAESNIEFFNRVTAFLNQLLEKHPAGNILVVAHGGIIRVIQSHFSSETFEAICSKKVDNAGIYEFEIIQPLNLIEV